MIVDTYVRMRDATSSMGTHREEMEANAFAAELLMPAELVRQAADGLVGETGGRIGATRLVRDLAQSFGVSQQAMEIRLGTLGILSPLIVASG